MTDNKHAEAVGLLPCPFCGGKAHVQIGMISFEDAEIHCQKCACIGPNFDDTPSRLDNSRLAIAAWNTRAALKTRPDVEAMKEACARVCDAVADNSRDEGIVVAGRFCATAIRSIPVPTSGEGA